MEDVLVRPLIFALVLFLLLPCATGQVAADVSSELEKYNAAAQKFEQLRSEAKKQDRLPRISEPETAATLAILANASGSLGTPAFPASAETMEADVCGAAFKATVAYMLFGLDKEIKPGMSSADSGQLFLAIQQKNFSAFQDEVVPLLVFSTHCQALHIPVVENFIANLPVEQITAIRRNGIKQLRLGIRQMVVGSIQQLADPNLKDINRHAMFFGVVRDLPTFVPILKPEERAQMRQFLEQQIAIAPSEFQEQIKGTIAAFQTDKCEGLCKY